MAKSPAKSAVATVKENAPPVEHEGVDGFLASLGGSRTNSSISRDRLIIPRIKLLQAINPEVEAFENAKAGIFWHNILNEPLGETFRFIPIKNREHYLLFAPRGDSRKVLARAPDGEHWDPADAEFEVKLKGVPKPVKWKTAKTVAQSGVVKFGSSNPADPKSTPAATLILEFLAYLPDHPDCSPAVISLARSQVKRGAQLETMIQLRSQKTHQFGQLFKATITKEEADDGPYNNWQFLMDGKAELDDAKNVVALAEMFKNKEYAAAEEDALGDETCEGFGADARGDKSSGGAGHKEY